MICICLLIPTSFRKTEDDIVSQLQLLQGRRSGLYFGFPLRQFEKRKILNPILVPTDTKHTHASLSLLTHSTYSTQNSPCTNFPAFLSSILPSAHTLHMPSSIPPCGHLNCLCIWKHLYIYSIPTLLPPWHTQPCIFHLTR